MIKLELSENKNLKIIKKEDVFVGDNNISMLKIKLPETIGGYSAEECTFQLYAVLDNDTHLVYPINGDCVRVTSDLTEREQTITLFIKITKGLNVIGRTNTVALRITNFTDESIEIAPRDELDAIIAQLESDKSELIDNVEDLEDTISEENSLINSLNSDISELNSNITNLNAANAALNSEISAKNQIISNLSEIYNSSRYQAKTVTPQSVPLLVTPDSGYLGLSAVMVEGTVASTPSGIFFSEPDSNNRPTKCIIMNYPAPPTGSYKSIFYNNILPALTEVEFRNCDTITSLENRFFWQCASIEKIVLPSNITSLSSNIFCGCLALKDITIPSSVTYIAGCAFEWCQSLEYIKIPSSVTDLDDYIFNSCRSLKKADFTEFDFVPTLGGTLINNSTNPNFKIVVANQTMKAAFRSATNWSNYAEKIITQEEYELANN